MALAKTAPSADEIVATNVAWSGRHADLLAEENPEYLARLLRMLLGDVLEPQGELAWLDVACGLGHAARAVSAKRYVGLDAAPEVVAAARAAVPEAEFVQGLATALPFPDGSFDRVLSLGLLPHLPHGHARCFLDEAARTLRAGGKLVLQWPVCFRDGWMQFPEHDEGDAWWFTLHEPRHIFALAALAGFADARGYQSDGYYWLFADKPAAP